MSTETPNVVHALATIGFIDGAPTLLKSSGIRAFSNPFPGVYLFELINGIDPQRACVNAMGRRSYAPSFTCNIDSGGVQVFVAAIGVDGLPFNCPCEVTINEIPVTEAPSLEEDPFPLAPVNWSGGPGAPPWSSEPSSVARVIALGNTDPLGPVVNGFGLTFLVRNGPGDYEYGYPQLGGIYQLFATAQAAGVSRSITAGYSGINFRVTVTDENGTPVDSGLFIQVTASNL